MTPFKFTQEMFDKSTLSSYLAADIANARLALWLKDAVKVYVCDNLDGKDPSRMSYKTVHFVEAVGTTHTALLINLTEIPKPECFHTKLFTAGHTGIVCMDCCKPLIVSSDSLPLKFKAEEL